MEPPSAMKSRPEAHNTLNGTISWCTVARSACHISWISLRKAAQWHLSMMYNTMFLISCGWYMYLWLCFSSYIITVHLLHEVNFKHTKCFYSQSKLTWRCMKSMVGLISAPRWFNVVWWKDYNSLATSFLYHLCYLLWVHFACHQP